MKFVETEKARGLKFNTPVFVRIDNDPMPAVGRMLKVEHTAQGVVRTFEIAKFHEDIPKEGSFISTKVTHVCIPS